MIASNQIVSEHIWLRSGYSNYKADAIKNNAILLADFNVEHSNEIINMFSVPQFFTLRIEKTSERLLFIVNLIVKKER